MEEVVPTIEILTHKVELIIIDLNSVSSQLQADFVILPGGSCDEAVINKELHLFIQNTLLSGGLVAGICNGAVILASSGVMKNRRCTHTAYPKYAPLPEFIELLEFAEKAFKDSIYIDEDVVIDGNIITAKPNAADKFAKVIYDKIFS